MGHRPLPAQADQQHIHQNGGQPPGDVVEEVGGPAGHDLPDHIPGQPGADKAELELPVRKGTRPNRAHTIIPRQVPRAAP